ncbi:D-sorbitol dehydrogenase (acceptor) (plasmid) [Ketogulonicigenium robustum]|uniref:D-sorbitol dehydrogenase (Acceptor) n=1 Tax=Ketogulonicigenium robustum TaxID=92947 RepID=A0A1W6P327_9RHOB|nr:c-type cytochrome [Ketogulonicigenium robustum]ARO15918.1 D-sorbitol dehydrogenase (acceptor) [Ketogulonicigenium robustum]
MKNRVLIAFAAGTVLAAPVMAQTTDASVLDAGRALVETHNCTGCHTETLGGQFFGGWYVPNISSDPIAGIGGWTIEELVEYLRDGSTAKGQAAGSMAGVVGSVTRRMTDDELTALATYLKSTDPVSDPDVKQPAFSFTTAQPASVISLDPAIDQSNPEAKVDLSTTDGAELYVAACATCHMPNGEGTADHFYPSLVGNGRIGGHTPNNLVQVILHGVTRDSNRGFPVAMPAYAADMNDEQIAAVANYVFARFGNPDLSVTGDDVALLRDRKNLPGQE